MDMSTLYPAGDWVAEKRACERVNSKSGRGMHARALVVSRASNKLLIVITKLFCLRFDHSHKTALPEDVCEYIFISAAVG